MLVNNIFCIQGWRGETCKTKAEGPLTKREGAGWRRDLLKGHGNGNLWFEVRLAGDPVAHSSVGRFPRMQHSSNPDTPLLLDRNLLERSLLQRSGAHQD